MCVCVRVCARVSIADIFRVKGKVMNLRGRCEEDKRGIGGGGRMGRYDEYTLYSCMYGNFQEVSSIF